MDSWEDQVRRFMLDEEEDDDELFLVMVPALQLCPSTVLLSLLATCIKMQLQIRPS